MKKFLALTALAALTAAPAAAFADPVTTQVLATQGKMLYDTAGKRLAAIYRVSADGSPQLILDGKMVTVPASSLSVDGDKVVTSLTKKDLRAAK